jgi:hypothetical protein
VVDVSRDVVGVEPGGLDRHGGGVQTDLLEHVAQPHALPLDRADGTDGTDGTERPRGAVGRGALLGVEEAAAAAGALVGGDELGVRKLLQVAQLEDDRGVGAARLLETVAASRCWCRSRRATSPGAP